MTATRKPAKASARVAAKRSPKKQRLKKAPTASVAKRSPISSKPKSKPISPVSTSSRKRKPRRSVRARASQTLAMPPPDGRLKEFHSTLTKRVDEWVSGMSDGERAQELVASASSGRGLTAVDIHDALTSESPLGVQLTRNIYEATHRAALDLVLNKTLKGGGFGSGDGGP